VPLAAAGAAPKALHALLVPKRHTKGVKTALERDGFYDNRRKIAAAAAHKGFLAVPIATGCVALVRRIVAAAAEESGAASDAPSAAAAAAAAAAAGAEEGAALRAACAHLFCSLGLALELTEATLPQSRWASSPAMSARSALRALLETRGVRWDRAQAMAKTLPHRWERVGDAVMVPRETFAAEVWRGGGGGGESTLLDEVWPTLARVFSARLVVRKSRVDIGPKRESRCELVWSRRAAGAPNASRAAALDATDTFVQVVQHGVRYTFDILKVMFSAGNVTERGRMGAVGAAGDVVVDLFCGIGYFTVPLLARAGAAHVHACEWNAHSVEALRRNLALNGVADRCTVYEGDNQIAAAKLVGVADRVLLGLLPDAERAYGAAVGVLKPQRGGWMHVHGNVPSTAEGRAEWSRSLEATFSELARARGCAWASDVHVRHVEVVKAYAPYVDHCVADVQCGGERGEASE
jgi:tRNA G37 N-methylase Trm5